MAFASHRRDDFLGLPLTSFSPASNSSSRKLLNRPSTDEPVFGSSTRLRFQTTSFAVNWRPLCHFTSLRRCSVQDFRSSSASHFAHSDGRVTLSTPVVVK